MSAATRRVLRPDPSSIDRREDHHRATFSACHTPPAEVVVTVHGEVDMTNGRTLAGYVEAQICETRHLVLDLRMVDFFGTAGFAALHNINVICSRSGVPWTLRAGRQIRRLLKICDPDRVLPLEKSPSVLDDVGARSRDRKFLIGRND